MVAPPRAVVIGGSAGAVEALSLVLPPLPEATPFPVIIVVHIPARRPSLLAELFRRKCAAPVREPFDKDEIRPGIWFAPPDYHLLVEADSTFSMSIDPAVNYSRPAIDVLFESAADTYRESLLAVILTGANEDGARGVKAVRGCGGSVIVQDPATAEATMMPLAAIREGAPHLVAPPAVIGQHLAELAQMAIERGEVS